MLLRKEIAPRGGRLIAPLRRESFSLAFKLPAPGRVRIRWRLLPARTSPRLRQARALLIAHGQHHFPEGESGPVTLRFTTPGMALLRHDNHAQLIAEATFTPLGGRPVTAIEPFTLRR